MMERSSGGILLPKHQDIKIINADSPNQGFRSRARVGGRFRGRKGKEIGCIFDRMGCPIPGTGYDVVTGEFGWTNNLVTNNGLDNLADDSWSTNASKCHVGTGNTAPVNGDTTLDSFLTGNSSITGTVDSQQGSAPYYASSVRTWRFAAGVAEGILAEIGAAPSTSDGDLYSRALILDNGGSPTTIQVLSDEWLDAVYEHRLYPDHILANGNPDDATGTVLVGGVSYDYAIRPALLTDGGSGGWYWIVPSTQGELKAIVNNIGTAYSSDATIGAVTSTPSASEALNLITTSGATISGHSTYTNGTYTRDGTWTLGLNVGNVSDSGGDGIGAFLVRTALGIYQCTFDASATGGGPIPKDATKIMTFDWTLAWDRATIP